MNKEAALTDAGPTLSDVADTAVERRSVLGVPMRRAKRQVTDPDELKAIVDACKTVRIAAADECGLFIVPMSFGYEWEHAEGGETGCGEDASVASASCSAPAAPKLTLWLHSATEGRKARAFADGAQVAIEMDLEDGIITGDYSCSYSFAFRSIMGQGSVHRVEDKAGKLKGLGLIMGHMAPGSCIEFKDEVLERVAVWRIDVEQFTGKCRAAKAKA